MWRNTFSRPLPDIHDLLELPENATSKTLILVIMEHMCNRLDRDILALTVHLRGLVMTNPCLEASFEQSSSAKVTTLLVPQIMAQSHQMPDDSLVKPIQQVANSEREKALQNRQYISEGQLHRKCSEHLTLLWKTGLHFG